MDFFLKFTGFILLAAFTFWLLKDVVVCAYRTPWVAGLFYVFIAAFLFVVVFFGFGAIFKFW
jgi:hypothetical protein